MASNDSSLQADDDSNFPFAQLDEFSKPLRQSALELAGYLSEIPDKSKEMILLISALTKINASDINVMDNALNNYKKAFASLTIRNTDDSIFGPGISDELLPQVLETYSTFIATVASLAEKAVELNDNSSGG